MKRVRAETVKPSKTKASPFTKGHERLGGRAKGTPNKVNALLKDCIILAAEALGSNGRGKDGLTGFLMWMAKKEPAVYGRLLEKLLPYQLTGAGGGPVQLQYTDKQSIVQRMKERGLPVPKSLMSAADADESAPAN